MVKILATAIPPFEVINSPFYPTVSLAADISADVGVISVGAIEPPKA
jgi:hypothetical protein